MKILTWNINGIRSLPKKLNSTLEFLNADIVCFQETKITRDALDSELALVEKYNAYFSFCRKRGGYSGVATFCDDLCAPIAAEEGLTAAFSNSSWMSTLIGCYSKEAERIFALDQLKSLDSEGRVMITKHLFRTRLEPNKTFYLHIFNVYCPRSDPEKIERKQFKLDFYKLLKFRVDEILKLADHHVMIVGDLNCSHRRIDHCDPDEDPEFDQNESRLWLTEFLWNSESNPNGRFVDVFRQLYPMEKNAFTCWNTKISARQTNYGTRIDYILMDVELFRQNLIKSIQHSTDVFGSDHCPVVVDLDLEIIPAKQLPHLCSKLMPEFRGVQQKLTSFVVKRESTEIVKEVTTNKKAKVEKKATTLLHFYENFKKKAVSSETVSSTAPSISSCSQKSDASQSSQNSDEIKTQWKNIFAPAVKRSAPVCSGHSEPCVMRTVKKQGPNLNRQFYCCSRPPGAKDNKDARCNHFEWIS